MFSQDAFAEHSDCYLRWCAYVSGGYDEARSYGEGDADKHAYTYAGACAS